MDRSHRTTENILERQTNTNYKKVMICAIQKRQKVKKCHTYSANKSNKAYTTY